MACVGIYIKTFSGKVAYDLHPEGPGGVVQRTGWNRSEFCKLEGLNTSV
jgi:hypothetical protein